MYEEGVGRLKVERTIHSAVVDLRGMSTGGKNKCAKESKGTKMFETTLFFAKRPCKMQLHR